MEKEQNEGFVKIIAQWLAYVVFVALEDVAEISSFLSIDEGKEFLVLWVQSAEGNTRDLDCGKMNLHHHMKSIHHHFTPNEPALTIVWWS